MMITPDATYQILFSANLAFIVTHLYSWLLKWFYKPHAYREHFHELSPPSALWVSFTCYNYLRFRIFYR